MTRRPELDALRGVLLLMMTFTHLPTRVSAYASQPLGFVSVAEGFVFLSAFVAGSGYSRLLRDRGAWEVRRRAWTRAAKLYGCHLGLLLFTVAIAAGFALHTERPALSNLLSVYFAEPAWAILGGLVLLRIRMLSLLGQASLPVFTTHLLICVASLGLIVDDTVPLSLTQEIGVLTLSLASMLFVASRAGTSRRERKPFAEPMKEV